MRGRLGEIDAGAADTGRGAHGGSRLGRRGRAVFEGGSVTPAGRAVNLAVFERGRNSARGAMPARPGGAPGGGRRRVLAGRLRGAAGYSAGPGGGVGDVRRSISARTSPCRSRAASVA